MRKKLFFLILLCTLIISKAYCVNAKEYGFNEAEYISMYLNKQPSTDIHTIYYQKARFFRQNETNKIAFCIEPQTFFKETSKYNEVKKISTLTDAQQERIKLIGYFGYNNKNRYTNKWYVISQLMMWKEADPTGKYYFTDSLNGNKINDYDNEIQEIEKDIRDYQTKPNISIPKIITKNQTIEVEDSNNILKKYKTNLGTISNNKLIIKNLEDGEYTLKLTRTFPKYNEKIGFYESNDSQNMFIKGDIDDIELEYKFKVITPSITISKIDKDTKSNKSMGEASLKGTTYKIYDENKKERKEIKLNENDYTEKIELDLGTYIIKEYKVGKGYKIDDKEHKVTLNESNPTQSLTFENEVIKKKISIHKTYGEEVFIGEPDVEFEIYNSSNELIDTLKTDKDGYIKTTLYYGKYTIKQKNTIEGYEKVGSFEIDVNNDNEEIFELKDYKIKVPNTYTYKNLFQRILDLIKKYVK